VPVEEISFWSERGLISSSWNPERFKVLKPLPESLPETQIYHDSDTFLANLARRLFGDAPLCQHEEI